MDMVDRCTRRIGQEANAHRGQTIVAKFGRRANSKGRLAGSDLDMAVRNTLMGLGLPVEEALRMASLYPAEFLGLEHRLGRIAPGYEADLVPLSDDLEVRESWIGAQSTEES